MVPRLAGSQEFTIEIGAHIDQDLFKLFLRSDPQKLAGRFPNSNLMNSIYTSKE